MVSFKYQNVYLKDPYSVVGPLESVSYLKGYDNSIGDYYFGEKTFEQAEVKMQRDVLLNLTQKEKIDLVIGGDLLNQISASNYNMQNFDYSFLGIYSACATFVEGLIVAGCLLTSKLSNIAVITSSHNLTAERQFRYPVEYGALKPKTATFTTTGSVGVIVSNNKSKYKIVDSTIGSVVNFEIDDANHLGAVMAPAAAKILYEHINNLNLNINDYDLVLTGDLGCVGAKIFKEYLKRNYKINLKKHIDAGCEIFLKTDNTYSGGSGPVCLPLVLFNTILKQNKYKKILVIATGALHSTTMVNQNAGIPAIAHAVSLEVI